MNREPSLIAAMGTFYVPENPAYTILDSALDSVRFTLERCLTAYRGHLAATSSFVNPLGEVMHWHDFGNLEGPGWAANAVGGAGEIYRLGGWLGKTDWQHSALCVLDHVLHDGFVQPDGFIWGYRETQRDELVLNYRHGNDWFCPGSMARIASQLLDWSTWLEEPGAQPLRSIATATGAWLRERVALLPNGWFPRRVTSEGRPYPCSADGGEDPLFASSGDGLFLLQLYTRLALHGTPGFEEAAVRAAESFVAAGGHFGSINHDTYDPHESVAYAVAFRVLREAAQAFNRAPWRTFAYHTCLAGLDRFKMAEDRNGVATTGLLWMEESWDTAYLWENAEAAQAFFEAALEYGEERYQRDGLTILRAIARHHYGPYGFLTEGVDWNNHVGQQHHIHGAKYGAIQYTEPFLNNQHIVEPTLFYLERLAESRPTREGWEVYDGEGNRLGVRACGQQRRPTPSSAGDQRGMR